jgi:hypothetical protein
VLINIERPRFLFSNDMRMPDESLEDFMTGRPVETAPEPPAFRPVRLSGEIEVLKPLVRSEALVKNETALTAPAVSPAPRPHWFSGFSRSLAAAGALAVVALLLTAAILVGIYRPHSELASGTPDAAPQQEPVQNLTPGDEPDLTSSMITTDAPPIAPEPRAVRPLPNRAASGFRRALYRVRRSLPSPRIVTSDFKPSTLIIYIQKGEIKTRIEPQLTSSYRPVQN